MKYVLPFLIVFLACAAASAIEIAAGPAREQIDRLVGGSRLNVIIDDASILNGVVTRPVTVGGDLVDALVRMLEGSGLRVQRVNARTVIIFKGQSTPTPPATFRKTSLDIQPPVIVTGTHLSGRAPVGARLVTVSHEEIQAAGRTLSDVLKLMPQIHGAGPSEDTREGGADSPSNSGRGVGINLRGLGASSTLVLLNGQRLAPSGSSGAFSDISNIPLGAVERMEMLADSASALYGSDAVAGVVNFMLDRDFTGSETYATYGNGTDHTLREELIGQKVGHRWSESAQGMFVLEYYSRDALSAADRAQARSDLRDFGGDNFDTHLSNPGTILTQNGIYAIPHAQDGTSLRLTDLVPGTRNLRSQYASADVVAAQRRLSAYSSIKYAPTPDLTFAADSLLSKRQAQAASGSFSTVFEVPYPNPFARQIATPETPVRVAYDFINDLGLKKLRADVTVANVNGSVDFGARNGWHWSASGSYATELQHQSLDNLVDLAALQIALTDPNPATAFNPFGDGSHTAPETLAGLRTDSRMRSHSELGSVGVGVRGPLFQRHDREATLALGGEWRRQSLGMRIKSGTSGVDVGDSKSRDVGAAYAELRVPALSKVDVSLALRYEGYSGADGESTSRLGFDWALAPALKLRGTWSQAFRLPALGQLFDQNNSSFVLTVPDPLSPRGVTTALFESGNNSQLDPEKARSWTVGLDYTLSDFQLALTHFNIHSRNRLEATELTSETLGDPNLAHLISRAPTVSDRAEVCARTTFYGHAGGCLADPIDSITDLRLRNISVLETRGIDLASRYDFNLRPGTLTLGLNATYVIDYEQAQTDQHDLIELVDTQSKPIDLRLTGSLGWRRGRFESTALIRYADSYADIASATPRKVSSWTTVDSVVRYSVDLSQRSWLDDSSFALSIENVFNQSPPFLNNLQGIGYDPENADLHKRRVSLVFRKAW